MREVHKFGGTSVGSAKALGHLRKIIGERAAELRGDSDRCELCVVVSAMGKTTDRLVSLATKAEQRESYEAEYHALKQYHMDIIAEAVPEESNAAAIDGCNTLFVELEHLLQGVGALEEASERTRARILSLGERISSLLVHYILQAEWKGPVEVLDARELIVTDSNFLEASVEHDETALAIRARFNTPGKEGVLYVIPGFVAGCGEETTLLGRGGSDYTASIFGAALQVEEVVIWTDVEGVKTADPRQVESALPVATLSFEEAMEISFFGAKIIYGPTMGPAMRARIRMRVKSTFKPTAPGTVITAGEATNGMNVQCVTSLSRVSVINLQGCGMVGVTGVSARLFTALWHKKINVVLISQASSEHSICLCVARETAQAAKAALEDEFARDMEQGLVDSVQLMHNHSIIAVVGEGMSCTPGILGKVASALGEANINIVCLAQGSSERNISCVVKADEERAALNAIHDAFFAE